MELSEAKKKAINIIYTLNEQIDDNDDLGFNREDLESMQEEIDTIQALLKALDNSISKDEVRKLLERENNQYNEIVNDVYKNPANALVDFQRVCGKREVLKELLGE